MFCLKRYFSFLNPSALSSHQYYTVSSFRTINGSSGRIFQYRKCFYFIRFNITHISGNSVDKYKRRSSSGKSTDSANPEFGIIITGLSGTLDRNQTCHLTGKAVIQASGRNDNVFGFYRTHGYHHTLFFLFTVTDYHYLIKRF